MRILRYRMNDYSVPTAYGFRDVLVKGFVDQVALADLLPILSTNSNGSNRSTHPGLCEKSADCIGSNSRTPSGDFSEIEATIHRLCDARGGGPKVGVLAIEDGSAPDCQLATLGAHWGRVQSNSNAVRD